MLGQTFDPVDLPRIFTLAFLEMLLSADNAIVLGLLTYGLPAHLRKKALYIGVASSFIFRAAGLLSVAYLLRYSWIQLFGAAYLLYLAIHHFIQKKRRGSDFKQVRGFWMTVLLIELFDLAFAIDSIVAGVAFVASTPSNALFNPKLWIVYFGGMIGLVGTRYAADIFSQIVDRFPRLETAAYLMIAWIGFKLGLNALDLELPYFQPIFWCVIITLFLSGFLQKRKA